MKGSLRFPKNMDEDAKDLIQWLLSKNPDERPMECSEIKKHPFFKDIHWGRIAKKEAIPPWKPDLYKFHGPKQVSLNQVFHKNANIKELNRTSHDNRDQKAGEELKSEMPVQEYRSGHQQIGQDDLIESSKSPKLHLQDFECEIESKEEE